MLFGNQIKRSGGVHPGQGMLRGYSLCTCVPSIRQRASTIRLHRARWASCSSHPPLDMRKRCHHPHRGDPHEGAPHHLHLLDHERSLPVRSPVMAVVRKSLSAHSAVVASIPDGAGAAMLLCPDPTRKSTPSAAPSTGIDTDRVCPVYRAPGHHTGVPPGRSPDRVKVAIPR